MIFTGLYLLLTWLLHLQGMQMIFSLWILIVTFKDPQNLKSLAETLKIVGPCGIPGARFVQLQGPLTLASVRGHQVPRGVVSRIAEGKSRAKALLNAKYSK